MKTFKQILLGITLLATLNACQDKKPVENNNIPNKDLPRVQAPDFNPDSAYMFVEKQVAFGPRVPNSKPHQLCGDFIISSLEKYGWQVQVQAFEVKSFDNKLLKSRNIIASFNPTQEKRILLAAHWDTRPFADQDQKDQDKPIDGANDGGSGVGVLLEIARTIGTATEKPSVGVDMIFFDAEDYGAPDDVETSEERSYYCLGSQYWAENKHTPDYHAYFGILLDMVGAPNARFFKEAYSMRFAPSVVDKVWKTAHQINYGAYFIEQEGKGGVFDDHIHVNQKANIPMIDIIEHDPSNESYFNKHWHTHKDNMDNIDRLTLKAVGQTVLQVIYNE